MKSRAYISYKTARIAVPEGVCPYKVIFSTSCDGRKRSQYLFDRSVHCVLLEETLQKLTGFKRVVTVTLAPFGIISAVHLTRLLDFLYLIWEKKVI